LWQQVLAPEQKNLRALFEAKTRTIAAGNLTCTFCGLAMVQAVWQHDGQLAEAHKTGRKVNNQN